MSKDQIRPQCGSTLNRSITVSLFLLSFYQLCTVVKGDVYMHNPRGSNDRNCERNVNRDNGNRLFNSQNNNNGGYACPRAVGDGAFQSEDGTHTFSIPTATGSTQYVQNKRMYYYSGSILPIEWTSQHGCGGNSKVSCEIILQYACEDTLDPKVDDFWPWVQNKGDAGTQYRGKQHFRDISDPTKPNIAAPRDGIPRDVNDAATDTIPDNEDSAIPNTVETRRFGMQENRDYYDVCQHTERNKGLYTADQIVRRNDRRGTRQNPNGDRHGFECPEERDYYPWWAPSPWIDIAVLSDSAGDDVCYRGSSGCTKRCNYYMNNTMNWNKKGYCDVDHATKTVSDKINNQRWQSNQWYNNPRDCVDKGFKWYEVSHADNLNLGNNFVCAKTEFSRVNQLGNARGDDIVSQSSKYERNDTNIFIQSKGIVATHIIEGVNANRFLWTVPDIPTMVNPSYWTDPNSLESAYKSCVLRIRYNISSADFQSWPIDAVDHGIHRMVDSANNSRTKYDPVTPLTQDPYVYIGPGDSEDFGKMFVRLAVNTNQYARTFQDRSYVFSIKPRPAPSTNLDADNFLDSPAFDWTAISNAINNGGKIYNVNVRGKRGNIVQVYPSVEYDFVPNALALNVNDMIHFQWTGSDYNPRRGCNDGEGGPPDLNTFFTDANANLNSRADRSNLIFTRHMGENVPKDYLGYHQSTTSLNFTDQTKIARSTVVSDVPCFDPTRDSADTAASCYAQVMRLAFLNQQSDVGAILLRQNQNCLTQAQLESIEAINKDVADNHPLNCAKMNAKPFPYFDGGIMIMKKWGWFPFFSSRNNNFSNRQQIGIICVGPQCKVDNSTSVLQDQNPAVSGKSITRSAISAVVAAPTQAPTATSPTTSATDDAIITAESFAATQTDNDNTGDGVAMGCAAAFSSGPSAVVEQQVGLALGLLAVGLFTSWLAYFLYNRYHAHRALQPKFRDDTSWQNTDTKAVTASDYRPKSMRFWHTNPAKDGNLKSGVFQAVPAHSTIEMNEPHNASSVAREEGNLPPPPPPDRKGKSNPLKSTSRVPTKSQAITSSVI